MNDPAGILGVGKSAASRAINNLVNDGLVFRNLDAEDRRFSRIGLTPKGREICGGIGEAMRLNFDKVFGPIPEDKLKQVLESMDLLAKAF